MTQLVNFSKVVHNRDMGKLLKMPCQAKVAKKKKITWDEALEACMPTILKLATQLSNIPNAVIDKDDLINCGLIGLMEAHQNFLRGREAKFTTFAHFRIKGAMLDEIRRYQPHKRNVIEKHKKIQKAQAKILNFPDNGKKKPTVSSLSGYSEKEIEKVARIISIKKTNLNVEELSREDSNPEHLAQRRQRAQNLKSAVDRLSDTERSVINFRFHKELRLNEIGAQMNLSEARIHQLEKAALFKLKTLVREEDPEIAA